MRAQTSAEADPAAALQSEGPAAAEVHVVDREADDGGSVLERWRAELRSTIERSALRSWWRRGAVDGGEGARGLVARAPLLPAAVVVLVAVASLAAAIAVVLARSAQPLTAPPLAPATTTSSLLDNRLEHGSITDEPGTTAPPRPTEVVVHAAGAVARPGLYRLPAGSRVADVVERAGGLTADADGDRINLAAAVVDGGRVYVPRRDEVNPPAIVATDGPAASGSAVPTPGATPITGPVDLNTADAAALDALPGIGPTTAAAILDYRAQHGPFRTVDELLKVRGIGKAKLDQIRSLVTT